MRLLRLPVLLVLSAASPLSAQRMNDAQVAAHRATNSTSAIPGTHIAPAPSSPTSASTRSMIVGGIIGGVLGAFGGTIAGMSVENCESSKHENCGLVGGIIGGFLGEAIGVPIGVNWVSGRRGTLKRSIPVSIGLTFGGLRLAGVYGLVIVPPAQIYTSIRAERGST